MNKIKLVLENGSEYDGLSFGFESEDQVFGEIVFNTSMTGYQEIFTDPSYCDQIVVMTYPLQGNYGFNQNDNENLIPHLSAVVVSEVCDKPSNWRNEESMSSFLVRHKIPGICGIDTRALTKEIREEGSMKAYLVKDSTNLDFKRPLLTDQIKRVSVKSPMHYPSKNGPNVVMVDFGFKKNILTSLISRNCNVIVVPYDTDFETIKSFRPKGILLSNGPGDPKDIAHIVPTIQKLQESYPMFAICMGHQIFALANKADTSKMKFGHRGANHPVVDYKNDRVYITSQNHGYAVETKSIDKDLLEVTQINLNDKTIEGLKHKTLDAFSVQYHPEASPGPNDTKFLFDDFYNLITRDDHAKR